MAWPTTKSAGNVIQATDINGLINNIARKALRLDGVLAFNSAYVKNVIAFPTELDNTAYWSQNGCTTTGDATTAPDGTLTADRIDENAGLSFHYSLTQQTLHLFPQDTQIDWEFYVKAAERTKCNFEVFTHAGTQLIMTIDLVTGAIDGTPSAGFLNPTVEQASNDWWRVTVSHSSETGSDGVFGVFVLHNGTSTSYTGDGTLGVYVWGVSASFVCSNCLIFADANGLLEEATEASYDATAGQISLRKPLALEPVTAGSSKVAGTPSTYAGLFIKDSFLVLQYRDGGTTRYKYLDLTGTGVTWVHSTTLP